MYEKRLNCPARDNKYYNSNINPFVPAGYGMFQNGGNCTCYAYGRFLEIGKLTSCKLSTNNAEEWYLKRTDGYERGQSPKLGAVICWEGKGSRAGHVAVVEQINPDGSIITSNSGWKSSLFYTQTLKPPYNLGSNYIFQGFIYNPYASDIPEGTVAQIQLTLNERYGYNLAVDNSAGPDTRKHLRMAMQHELNIQFNAGLAEDGSFGPATQRALKNVVIKYGSHGNMTWLVQACLYIKGYDPNGLDSNFGPGMKRAVGNFQKNNNLYVDYIVGYNTFMKLFN